MRLDMKNIAVRVSEGDVFLHFKTKIFKTKGADGVSIEKM